MRLVLDVDLIKACEAYGERQAQWYVDHPSTLSTHGMEANPGKLALWRMCECAAKIALGVDPQPDRWTVGPDRGFDIPWLGLRFDVKGTLGGRLLIYPASKTAFYDQHRFDILVLVVADPPVFEIAGWRTKAMFKQLKRVAGPRRGRGLDEGTWSMDRDDLQPIELLLMIAGIGENRSVSEAMGATGKGKEAVVFSEVISPTSSPAPL